ncbi:hypothetical protein TELCIR_10472 [Teladorsagia circumcincta]|uniref:Uncharacterized protein n=1 Tax=Teladorsagia circumcincta TaxID=45464 RepID=A0A2G9UC12_TELCI|nr:hypothetical protein TELCIR_10472 [Teladorsagia circumcincta]
MFRSRPERGKFTILDGTSVAEPDEILDIDFDADLLQRIFRDSRVGCGIQFLARYGIIPNTRECKIESCPKEQLMSLIKHANGFVFLPNTLVKTVEKNVKVGSTIVMRDLLMKRFGEKEELDAMLENHTLKTIADVWCDMDEEERDK